VGPYHRDERKPRAGRTCQLASYRTPQLPLLFPTRRVRGRAPRWDRPLRPQCPRCHDVWYRAGDQPRSGRFSVPCVRNAVDRRHRSAVPSRAVRRRRQEFDRAERIV
jgi:hypothetical protein